MSAPNRIAAITLDDSSIKSWGPDVDHERRVAIFDLLEQNSFAPIGDDYAGPFNVFLSIEDDRLVIDNGEDRIRTGPHCAGAVAVPEDGQRLFQDM